MGAPTKVVDTHRETAETDNNNRAVVGDGAGSGDDDAGVFGRKASSVGASYFRMMIELYLINPKKFCFSVAKEKASESKEKAGERRKLGRVG